MSSSAAILVTGCAGFIGYHLSDRLLREGYSVVGLDDLVTSSVEESDHTAQTRIKERNVEMLSNRYPVSFSFRKEDAATTSAVREVSPNTIVHLAGLAGVRASFTDPGAYVNANVRSQANLLSQAVGLVPPPLYIYASSSSVYGKRIAATPSVPGAFCPFREDDDTANRAESPYAWTKKASEDLAEMYTRFHPELRSIGLRFFTVYGPGGRPDMCPHIFLRSVHRGETIHLYGDPDAIFRDFTYIDDVVDGIIRSIAKSSHPCNRLPAGHHIYNIASNRVVSLREFMNTCQKVVDKPFPRVCVHEGPRRGDVPVTFGDTSKARDELGYLPRTCLVDGIGRMYEYVYEHVFHDIKRCDSVLHDR